MMPLGKSKILFGLTVLIALMSSGRVFAQSEPELTGLEEPLPIESEPADEIVPALPLPGSRTETTEREKESQIDEVTKTGEAGEGETRWNVSITVAVIMNYVFNDSPDSFLVKYRMDLKGQANAATAVIDGNVDVEAKVDNSYFNWPTGECKLEITVPRVPFELTFKKTEDGKGNLKLVLKQQITEDWQSRCTFADGAKFDTRGAPEMWLSKALEKARPPLKDIVAELADGEETTTTFVINKEEINDAPVGTIELEGTGVVTIRPGGE